MKVPLYDLEAEYRAVGAAAEAACREVLADRRFVLGPKVAALEQALAARLGAPFALGVSSGTDALLVSLMALGIGPGDEVVTTPYTFFATASSIARLGAKPVFADILPDTFNIDPGKAAAKVTARTKAILPVHLFGQCADMGPLLELAAARGIPLIEDAAQAIGAAWRGRPAGALGRAGCFSFYPTKNLGAAGDAGLVTAADAAMAESLRRLRDHGMHPRYYHSAVGGNFRLDALQAAILLVKLPCLDGWTAARRENARRYAALFAAAALPGVAPPPPPAGGFTHVYNQYVVRVPRRDALRAFLAERGIGTEIYYPVPLHLQECFRHLGHRPGDFPESERAAAETLSLPVHPFLAEDQQKWLVDSVAEFYRR